MYVIINGVSSDTIQGLQVLSLPPITKPKMRRQVDTIDGRAGDIITELGYEAYDRTITVLLHHNYDLDAITAFFNTSGEIIFSNEPDKKYYFRLLEKIDYERAVQFKTANITFHVQPYKYPVTETPLTVSTTAWEGTDYDQTPYIFRSTKDSSVEVGNREIIEQITGGTVAWNQLLQNGDFSSLGSWRAENSGSSVSVSNNEATVTLNSGQPSVYNPALSLMPYMVEYLPNHVYLTELSVYSPIESTIYFGGRGSRIAYKATKDAWTHIADMSKRDTSAKVAYIGLASASQLTTGQSIKFKNIKIHDLTQMFGSAIADYIYSLETATAGAGVSLFKSLFSKDYYAYNSGELLSVKTSAHKTYDADDNVLGSYPLSNIELRGIPKLVSNKIQYDGDIYKSDGSVARRYGIVDLGTLSWTKGSSSSSENIRYFTRDLDNIVKRPPTNNTIANIMSSAFVTAVENAGYLGTVIPCITLSFLGLVSVYGTSYADATTFKAAMSGVMLVYELASPATETTTPYTETQICDADGTEEFIDTRDVQVPVGHKTRYMQINDPAEITVPNAGNVSAAPTIQLTGSGTVGVYLGNAQALQVNIPEDGITIDTEAQDATSNGQLANRSVTGDYDSVRLQPGDNGVSFSGDVSAVITKYTRWI